MIVEESSNLVLEEAGSEEASATSMYSEEVASLLKPAKEGILSGLVEDWRKRRRTGVVSWMTTISSRRKRANEGSPSSEFETKAIASNSFSPSSEKRAGSSENENEML